MVLGTNIKQVTACFQISTFEEKLLKNALKTSCSGIHSLSGDGIKCWNRKEKNEQFQGNYIASPKALTIQYMVLFSHLTVQVPANTETVFQKEKEVKVITCNFILVSFKNLRKEAFTTAKHFIHNPVSITARWKKYQTVCYHSKTTDLGGGREVCCLVLKRLALSC